jgi:hypothetical protein
MGCKNGEMDSRCPRALEDMPDNFCPLAVLRLKAIRNAGRELTEEEEANLPGCPWAVNHQLAHYCFFKYISDYSGDKPPSDVEIASLNGISIDTVKKTEKAGLAKIRAAEQFQSIKDLHGDDAIVADTLTDDDYKIYR